MAATRYFLDEAGLQTVAEELLGKINALVNSKIVTVINDQSTDSKVPSAKAVYDSLQAVIAGQSVGIEFVVVSSLPVTGEPATIYLIKADDDPNSNVYVQWIYVGNEWINLGSSEIDLSGYWSKDELEPISNQTIQQILDEVFD